MDDRDVLTMERYIFENFPHPSGDKCDSYCRWAAEEILERIIDEASKLPSHITGIEPLTAEEIVESFIGEMELRTYESGSEEGRLIFSVARDEASCILHYIRSSR